MIQAVSGLYHDLVAGHDLVAAAHLVQAGTGSVVVETETDFESEPEELLLDSVVAGVIAELDSAVSSGWGSGAIPHCAVGS